MSGALMLSGTALADGQSVHRDAYRHDLQATQTSTDNSSASVSQTSDRQAGSPPSSISSNASASAATTSSSTSSSNITSTSISGGSSSASASDGSGSGSQTAATESSDETPQRTADPVTTTTRSADGTIAITQVVSQTTGQNAGTTDASDATTTSANVADSGQGQAVAQTTSTEAAADAVQAATPAVASAAQPTTRTYTYRLVLQPTIVSYGNVELAAYTQPLPRPNSAPHVPVPPKTNGVLSELSGVLNGLYLPQTYVPRSIAVDLTLVMLLMAALVKLPVGLFRFSYGWWLRQSAGYVTAPRSDVSELVPGMTVQYTSLNFATPQSMDYVKAQMRTHSPSFVV